MKVLAYITRFSSGSVKEVFSRPACTRLTAPSSGRVSVGQYKFALPKKHATLAHCRIYLICVLSAAGTFARSEAMPFGHTSALRSS
jgi:hypothetical protein